jgi:hypothetical protein
MGDASWSSGARAAGAVGKDFWALEVSIPLKNLSAAAIVPGRTVWKANFGRNEKPENETSSWSPATAAGFHDPMTFGTITFVASVPGVSDVSFPAKFGAGNNVLRAKIHNADAAEREFVLVGQAVFSPEDKADFSDAVALPAGKDGEMSVNIPLCRDNKGVVWNFAADKDPTESMLVSKSLAFKPKAKYRFTAQVKADYRWNGKGAYNFFVIRQPSRNYKGIPGAVAPLKTDGWRTVSGTWENGDDTSGELWVLKWAQRNIKGVFAVDNISLVEVSSGKELMDNGHFQNGGVGWTTFRKESCRPGYGAGAEAVTFSYTILGGNTLLYQSPGFRFKLAAENAAISSRFLYFGDDGAFPVEELYLASGAPELVSLTLKSDKADRSRKAFAEIITPLFCRLVPPADRTASLIPESIKEEVFEQDGGKFRRYLLAFDGNAVSRPEFGDWGCVAIPLVFETFGPYRPQSGEIKYKAWLDAADREPDYHRLAVAMLPPLEGKQPERLPLVIWAYSSMAVFEGMGAYEREKMIDKIAMSGYNFATVSRERLEAYRRHGVKGFSLLPDITCAGSVFFPYVEEFLKEYPDYAAITPDGKKAMAIDPARLLEKDSLFHGRMRETFAAYARVYPESMNLDYEFGFMPKGDSFNASTAIGYSARNLELFRTEYKIPPEKRLDAKTVIADYRSQWLEFRCRQNAKMVGLYSQLIKEVAPNCLFSLYSAYPPYSAETYGIDWRYASGQSDLDMCGYGGDNKLMMSQISRNYYVAGILLMSYADQKSLENAFANYLAVAGAYLGYVHFVVDGRYFSASAKAAAAATDFEKFFLNLKGNQKDHLTVDANTGAERGDIRTITSGDERLLMFFNHGSTPKEVVATCLRTPDGFVGVAHDDKRVYPDLSAINITVPPYSFRIVYVCPKAAAAAVGAAPQKLSASNDAYPILRWWDTAAAVHKYELEYAFSPDMKGSRRVRDITAGFYQLPVDAAGRTVCWRVKTIAAVSGAEGGWSQTAQAVINEKAQTLDYKRPAAYREDAFGQLGYWNKVSYGGGSALGLLTEERVDGVPGGYALSIENQFASVRSYWTNYRHPGGSTKLPLVKKGEKYQLTARLKTQGEIKSSIGVYFIDGEGKFMREGARSEIASGANSGWIAVKAVAEVPAKAVTLRLFFGGDGKGTAYCADLRLSKLN